MAYSSCVEGNASVKSDQQPLKYVVSAWSERPFMNSLLLGQAQSPRSWGPRLWGL
jgi:hypothetical protein